MRSYYTINDYALNHNIKVTGGRVFRHVLGSEHYTSVPLPNSKYSLEIPKKKNNLCS